MDDLVSEKTAASVEDYLKQREFVALRGFSNRIASWFDWTTPNWVTVSRIFLCAPLAILFAKGFVAVSTFIFALCLILDFIDGALARYQSRKYGLEILFLEDEEQFSYWQRMKMKGSTHLGAILDPLCDKPVYFVCLFALGWGYVYTQMILWSLIVAILLTAVRPIKRAFKLGSGKSNRLGKIKIWFEILTIAVLIFVPRSTSYQIFANIALGLALLFGVLSLSGHVFLLLRSMKRPRFRRRRRPRQS